MGDATTTTTTTATAATPTNIDYADNEQNPRVPEEEFVLPISYGSVAYWLGKKSGRVSLARVDGVRARAK
jgi:hypothetical protein